MKTIRLAMLWLVLLSPIGVSAGEIDPQFRLLLHGQKLLARNFGVAGWGIVPDTTNPNPRGLILGGFFYKDEKRWAEFMGGTFISGKGEEPLFDLRYSERGLKPLEG
jgi:hypothetical protein